jgi:hypothetical protein
MTAPSNGINLNEEQPNTSNLYADSESDEDRIQDESDSASGTETPLDGSDDEVDDVLDHQNITNRLAQLETEDSQPFTGETLGETSSADS